MLLLAAGLTVPAAPSAGCDTRLESVVRMAGEGKQPENRGNRERCKRTDASRPSPSKSCPDGGGGERVPQDKRSPLDEAPPLAPLVA